MRKTFSFAGLALVAAAGVSVSLLLASPAAAYTIDQLPSLGYSVSVVFLTDDCKSWSAGYGNAAKTDLGSDCDSGFQARVDALVQATCPCAKTTTTATTTATATTTPAPTTTDATTTTATVPATTTDVTTTTPPPPPPPPATTTVVTTDPATSAAVADLQTRVATLETQVVALTARVDKLVVGQTVTLSARAWTVASAKDGLATLVAKVKRPGERVKPQRKVPSAVLVPLIAKR